MGSGLTGLSGGWRIVLELDDNLLTIQFFGYYHNLLINNLLALAGLKNPSSIEIPDNDWMELIKLWQD